MSAPARTARVLVTNAEERSILGTCRSLHAAGYEVGAVAFRRLAVTHASRSCSQKLLMTDPAEDAEQFVEDLRGELLGGGYQLLLPGSDRALLAISRMRDRLEGLTRIGLPPPAVVERSLNREELARSAALAGLSPAESVRCADLREAHSALQDLGLPVILKSIAAVEQLDGVIRQARPSTKIATEDELEGALDGRAGAFLLQRAEPGVPLSVGGVIVAGRLLGMAVARYLRTWPPEAGNVAFSETIAPPKPLEEMVQALLAGIGWEGIFELELIHGEDDRFIPIDLNPRPYGSMALAVAAGAPLPAIWCECLAGGDPRPARAQPGHRYRWEDADMRNGLWQLRHGNLRAAAAAARPRRRVTHAYLQIADPLPLLVRGLNIAHLPARGHEPLRTSANRLGHNEPPAT